MRAVFREKILVYYHGVHPRHWEGLLTMGPRIFWTVICTVAATVITVIAFKAAGIEPGGLSGGIGAGVGVALGAFIAAKRGPSATAEHGSDDES